MKNFLLILTTVMFAAFILLLSIRGNFGNINENTMAERRWTLDGPFELSNERGRFALTYSFLVDHSFSFSIPVARFATPDLGYTNGRFVSLFPPAVSFIAMPGFVLGSKFNLNQVGAFATISLFSIFNIILIYLIATKLGLSRLAAAISSLVYVFASPAFAYSITLYQHQISTFLMLAAMYFLLKGKNFWSLAAIWFFCATSILVDYPNLVLMAPLGIAAILKLVDIKKYDNIFKINIKLFGFSTIFVVIIPLLFLMWFNVMSYGNPFQLSQTTRRIAVVDEKGNLEEHNSNVMNTPEEFQAAQQETTAVGFFQSRNLLNGFYEHFISLDRGMIFFTPVMLFAALGACCEYKRKNPYLPLLVSIFGANVLLYSMWGDPWGGWSFGSRYLVPSYAVLSILIASFLTNSKKNIFLILMFFLVFIFSVFVNTLGALTSNANPPEIEAGEIERVSNIEQKYTFFRNWDLLKNNQSKSFIYRTYANNYFSVAQYYFIISLLIIAFSGSLITLLILKNPKN